MSDDLLLDDSLWPEQARQLRMVMHACVDQIGGHGVLIDEDDRPSTCRLAPVGACLIVADFAGDRTIIRFREIHLYAVEAGGERFKLDPRHRLCVFAAQSFALPPDWHLQRDRPPELWLRHAMTLMVDALQPYLPDLPAA